MLSCNGKLTEKAKLQKIRAEKESNIYISILRSKQLEHTKYTFVPYIEKFIEALKGQFSIITSMSQFKSFCIVINLHLVSWL